MHRIVTLLREPVLIFDSNLCVVYWNKAAQSLLGVDEAERSEGKPCMEALGTKAYGKTISRVARMAISSGREANARLSVVRSGGREVQWTVRAVSLENRDEDTIVFVVLNLERSSGEFWMKGFTADGHGESMDQSRILLDLLPDIVFEVDAQGRLLYANGMALELLGYSPDVLASLNLRDLLSPTDQIDLDEVLKHMIGGEFIHRNLYYNLIRGDGARIPVEVNAIVIQGPDEKPRILGIARDHTLQFRLEERLRQSEERYRDLFESSRDIIFSMDTKGVVLEINRAGVALRGRPRHQIVGNSFSDMLAQSSVPAFNDALQKTVQTRHVDVEVEMVGKRGNIHILEVALAPFRQKQEVLQVHGTARDITEKKKLRDQVNQFQRMESLGRLAAGVAHDFNNVLGAVLGLASVLEVEMADNPKCKADLGGITQAARQGSELTRQILSFARGGPRRNKVMDLNKIVAEVVQLLARVFSSNVSIEVESDLDLPIIIGDSGQILQVVMNLCMNAYDAIIGDGAIRIAMKKTNRLPGNLNLDVSKGEFVELSVSDNGTGIPDEIKPHVFEPFFTTKSQETGIGLGLSVCWGIIHDHGGHICMDSKPGQGSVFRVYLPAASIEEKQTENEEVQHPETSSSRGLALVVDDQEPMLRAGRRMLEQAGYSVVCARCWTELETLLETFEEAPALTILDLGLPDTDGLTVFREMKKRFGNPYVIAVSGYSYEGSASRILEEGAKEFIQKPFSWKQLKDVLDRISEERPET